MWPDSGFSIASVGFENIGLMDTGCYLDGPISFDKACSHIKNTKPKNKKFKEIKELVENVVFHSSFFDCIGLRRAISSLNTLVSKKTPSTNGDSISNGEFSLCKSLTDSEVLRCNNRLLKNPNSDVGRKVWNTITKLGVVSRVDTFSNVKIIEDMELRDTEGLGVKKVVLSLLS